MGLYSGIVWLLTLEVCPCSLPDDCAPHHLTSATRPPIHQHRRQHTYQESRTTMATTVTLTQPPRSPRTLEFGFPTCTRKRRALHASHMVSHAEYKLLR